MSLFEESPRSILGHAIVIHQLPDDRARATKNVDLENRLIACGLLTLSQVEEPITIDRESTTYGSERAFKKIEQGILNGEQSWENVRHPHYGAIEGQKVPSNLNLEGVERPTNVDSLTLETAAPTRKGKNTILSPTGFNSQIYFQFTVWMAGYTYEYDYAGWTSTGIMGISTKVSGGSIKGRLTIEPVDESTAVVAVSE